MSKMVPSLIFEKHIFPAENAGNMPEKPVFFGIFSRFHHLFFLIFRSKMRINNAQNIKLRNLIPQITNLRNLVISFQSVEIFKPNLAWT